MGQKGSAKCCGTRRSIGSRNWRQGCGIGAGNGHPVGTDYAQRNPGVMYGLKSFQVPLSCPRQKEGLVEKVVTDT